MSTWIFYVLSIFPALLPFIFFITHPNPYEFPKFLSVVVVSQLVLFFVILPRYRYLRATKLLVSVVIFMLVLFVANILGSDPYTSFMGSVYRYQGFVLSFSLLLFFLGVSVSPHEMRSRMQSVFASSTIYSSVVLAILAIFQAVGGVVWGIEGPTYLGRIVATMGNPNFLGAYLVIGLTLVLFKNFLRPKSGYLWDVFFCLILLAGMYLTGSRSALLAAVVVTLCFVVQQVVLKKNFKRGLMVVGALCVGIVVFTAAYLPTLVRYSQWDNQYLVWEMGINGVAAEPILGYGQENFEYVIPPKRFYAVDNSHNLFLEVAVNAGVVGLVVFGYIIFRSLRLLKSPLRFVLIALLIPALFNPLSVVQLVYLWYLIGFANMEEGRKLR